jgi:hypothetical protein
MKKPDFWKHIELSKRSDPEEHEERLVNRLSKLPPSDILQFEKWWNSVHDAAYTWKLWGAAYLMNGGCSDDGFVYFRSWLILKGEAIYAAALKDPDTLSRVRVEPDEAEWEKPRELPKEKSLGRLSRWGRVAVIARAIRRAMPLIVAMLEMVVLGKTRSSRSVHRYER